MAQRPPRGTVIAGVRAWDLWSSKPCPLLCNRGPTTLSQSRLLTNFGYGWQRMHVQGDAAVSLVGAEGLSLVCRLVEALEMYDGRGNDGLGMPQDLMDTYASEDVESQLLSAPLKGHRVCRLCAVICHKPVSLACLVSTVARGKQHNACSMPCSLTRILA